VRSTGFRRGEQGSAFVDRIVESGDEDGVVGEGTSSMWGIDVVIGAVTVIAGRATAVAGDERDDNVGGVGVQLSGRRHGAVGWRLPCLESS
jgi:hypothetical protein